MTIWGNQGGYDNTHGGEFLAFQDLSTAGLASMGNGNLEGPHAWFKTLLLPS